MTAPDVDVPAIVQTQRDETMRTLQQLTRLKMDADEDADLAWLLVLDRLIFDAEAEARWLDHCESRLARALPPEAASAPRHRPQSSPDPGRHPMTARRTSQRTSTSRTNQGDHR